MMTWVRIKTATACAVATIGVFGVTAASAAINSMPGGELRMPEEPRFAKVEYPKELLEAQSGFILNFYPDSWLECDLGGAWKLKLFRLEEDQWKDFVDPGLAGGYSGRDVPTNDWLEIPVPATLAHEVASPDRKDPFRGIAWYRHAFTLPPEWAARLARNWRVLLRFEGVRDSADAWLNGQAVGEKMDGYSDFQFDVTDKLAPAGSNQLAVCVHVGRGGKGYKDSHPRTGLWQPVRLIGVPPTFVERLRVATWIEPASLQIRARIVNHGPAGSFPVEAVLTPWNVPRDKERVLPLGTVELAAGVNEKDFRVETPGVSLWSTEAPNLYLLALRSGQTELARTRVGFRVFEARDGDFYLNGQKVKLMGFQFSGISGMTRAPGGWGANYGNHARKLLYGLKRANINMGRPHYGESDGAMCETVYNLCDELGLLIYDEAAYTHGGLYETARLQQWGREFEQHVLQVHNHAACVMWDYGGNERYTADAEAIPMFNYLYDLLEKTDIQRRPKTSSSGRLSWRTIERLPVLEKADFSDAHDYQGYHNGSYQDMIESFARQDRAAKKRIGNVPTLNCEWGFPGDQTRYRASTVSVRDLYLKEPWGVPEKRQWIEWATSEDGETGIYLRDKGNWAGGRLWATDPLGLWERKAVVAKRFLEVYRRAGDAMDGGHFNNPYYCLLVHGGGGHEGIHAAAKFLDLKLPFEQTRGESFMTPAYYTWRRVYNPTFVCLDLYEKNTFAGVAWQGTAHLMNDTHKDAGAARAVVQLRAPDGRLLHQACIWQGQLKPYARLTAPIQLALAPVWPTGRYALELYLLGPGGARLSDNSYELNVVAQADLRGAIQPKGRVGLYEVAAEDQKPQATTGGILRSLSIPHKPVQDFGALKDVDVLVIGRDSLDAPLAQNGSAIVDWVRRGGRLLCFEQSRAGRLPFLPEVKVEPGKHAIFTELLVPKHPVFAGLGQADFDDWNGQDGYVYANILAPLNEGMLSVGNAKTGADSLRTICAAYAVGQGEIVLSQYEVTSRYGKDSAATRFAQNLLAYVLTQPRSALSLPFETKVALQAPARLDAARACYVDLRAAANAAPEDFAGLPSGVTPLGGDVPFDLIDPATNNGKSFVALRGTHRSEAPMSTEPLPVGRKLAALYLLHYATWASGLPEGETVYSLRVAYADGKEQLIPIRNKVEVLDWWQAPTLDNARVVFTEGDGNLFFTRLPLSDAGTPVQTIRFESAGKANPVVLALTGETIP